MSGKKLGAELYQLWKAGRVSLRTAAADYARASGSADNTSLNETEAFKRTPATWGTDPNGELGPAFPAWKEARDRFQTILAETSVNLRDTGDALCSLAEAYAATDADAASKLAESQRELLDDSDPNARKPPEEIPPPVFPDS
ncbi:MAG: hypothetical protein ACRDXX_12395 [Stackebrandtia sp.]